MRYNVTPEDNAALCRQAPEFSEIVALRPESGFECAEDLFAALVQSVVSQQLALAAADAILTRLEKLLGVIAPEELQKSTDEELRKCGLSLRKINYLRGIADAALSGKLDFSALHNLADNEVKAELVKLKGVGEWTAEMILIFALGRRDILSVKDLGIRRGLMMLHNVEEITESDVAQYRQRYSPYGTLASLYLWKIKDGGLRR